MNDSQSTNQSNQKTPFKEPMEQADKPKITTSPEETPTRIIRFKRPSIKIPLQNRKFIALGVFLLMVILGGITLVTARRLTTRKPLAPTAPPSVPKAQAPPRTLWQFVSQDWQPLSMYRTVPMAADGSPDWANANPWTQPSSPLLYTTYSVHDVFVDGRNILWEISTPSGSGGAYKYRTIPVLNNGSPDWANAGPWIDTDINLILPEDYVFIGFFVDSQNTIWQTVLQYGSTSPKRRTVPMAADGSPDWANASAWDQVTDFPVALTNAHVYYDAFIDANNTIWESLDNPEVVWYDGGALWYRTIPMAADGSPDWANASGWIEESQETGNVIHFRGPLFAYGAFVTPEIEEPTPTPTPTPTNTPTPTPTNTPTPTVTPTSTPTPTNTPTPTPTATPTITPTPTPTPPILCLDLTSTAEGSILEVGQLINLTCLGSSWVDNPITHVEFQVQINGGAWQDLGTVEATLNPENNYEGTLFDYQVPSTGLYRFECRVCAGSFCSNWGQAQ